MSLLAKWRWRLLQPELPLWKLVLRDKYGDSISGLPPEEGVRWLRYTSGWWRDLMSLEDGVGSSWFSMRVERKVSSGRDTSFWKDKWFGDQSLALAFPQLYSISSQKEAKVRDVWSLINSEVTWNLTWRRLTFHWENNLIVNLLAILHGVILGEEEDKWVWLPEESEVYSVSSSYRALEELVVDEAWGEDEVWVFTLLWKSPAPSKLVAFSWMALPDRIPTYANLALRHSLAPGLFCICVFCGNVEVTTHHLFLHCEVVLAIWRKVLDWLNINFITPHNLFSHFACWSESNNSRHLVKAFCLIWHAVIWSIWKERNARIFKNQVKNVDEVFGDFKVLSWCWALSGLRISHCLFYE